MRKQNAKITAWILAFVLVVYGLWMTRDSVALPAIEWMNVFRVTDFPDFAGLVQFILNLRIAIPPVLAIFEILNYQLTGTTNFVSIYLYRAGLIASYLLALRLTYPSVARMIVTFLASLVFIYGTVIIHPGNPQVYDVLYPCFILWSIYLLRQAKENIAYPTYHNLLYVLTGFFLSMAELSRPFFILILPFLLFNVWIILGKIKRSSIILLLLPLILLSGIWHIYIGVKFDQFFWSNNGGFNLWRAWKEYYYTDPVPMNIIGEVNNQPLSNDGRWENLNTPERYYNSQEFQRGIATWWFRHPRKFFIACVQKVLYFISTPTELKELNPTGFFLPIYRGLSALSFLFLFANGLGLFLILMDDRGNISGILASTNTMLIIITILSITIMSLTEKGEESRLVISLLPMLAIYPSVLDADEQEHLAPLRPKAQISLFVTGAFLFLSGLSAVIWVQYISGMPIFTFVRTAAITSTLVTGIMCMSIAFYNKKLLAKPDGI